jgi:cobyric acid synthase
MQRLGEQGAGSPAEINLHEGEIDRLADMMEGHLDMARVRKLLGQPGRRRRDSPASGAITK